MIVTVIQSILGIHLPNLHFIVRYLIVVCHSGIAKSQFEEPVYYKHIFHLYSYSSISSIHEGQKRQLENLNGYSIHRNRPLKCPYKWLHVLCKKIKIKKDFLCISHAQRCFPVCKRRCCLRLSRRGKVFLHVSHEYGRSPVCTRTCCLR